MLKIERGADYLLEEVGVDARVAQDVRKQAALFWYWAPDADPSILRDAAALRGAGILPKAVELHYDLKKGPVDGAAERLGLDYEQLRELRSDLIWVAATGYGPDAPGSSRPCSHPVAGAAMGGVVFQAGAGMPPGGMGGMPGMM